METSNIPWSLIDQKLRDLGKKPAWLAMQLGTGTNTTTNWKKRGGAPVGRATDIAKALGCTTDELLFGAAAEPIGEQHGSPDAKEESHNPSSHKTSEENPAPAGWGKLDEMGRAQVEAFISGLLSRPPKRRDEDDDRPAGD